MSRLPGQLAQAFVGQVHRRRRLIRCAEFVGVGACVGSGVSVVATLLLAWRGGSTVELIVPTSILLALGAACGIIVAFRRRASFLDTAMHIDRELRADDLIASAILPQSDSTFSKTVLALADGRVAGLNASSFPLRRFASRAWTGIGLAVACAVTTSLLFTTSPTTMRADETFGAITKSSNVEHSSAREESLAKPNRTAAENASESDDSSARNGEAQRNLAALSDDASGEGRAKTNDLKASIASNDSATIGHSSPALGGDRIAENGNGAATNAAARDPNGFTSGTVARDSSAATPWSSTDWPADRAAAKEAIRTGTIPDAYRALVRAYFDLDK